MHERTVRYVWPLCFCDDVALLALLVSEFYGKCWRVFFVGRRPHRNNLFRDSQKVSGRFCWWLLFAESYSQKKVSSKPSYKKLEPFNRTLYWNKRSETCYLIALGMFGTAIKVNVCCILKERHLLLAQFCTVLRRTGIHRFWSLLQHCTTLRYDILSSVVSSAF